MDYRDILRDQLERRRALNPRYSLRSFARKLALSPSKLSEVLAGKKHLGGARAEQLAEKLNLSDQERDLFILSAQLHTLPRGKDRAARLRQLQKLQHAINAGRTSQRNAWYFGAVNALVESGHDDPALADRLGITPLQWENARRYIRRLRRMQPDRSRLVTEPASLLRRLQEQMIESDAHAPEVDVLFLSESQVAELQRRMRRLIIGLASDAKATEPTMLHLVYWGVFPVAKK